MRKLHLLLIIPLVFALGFTCGPLSRFIPSSNSTPAPVEPTAFQPTSAQEITIAPENPKGLGTIDALVQGTLLLRSVKISLHTTRPDGQVLDLAGEIDADGNQHFIRTYSGSLGFELPSGNQNIPESVEFYVLGGTAYGFDTDGNLVEAEDQSASNYLQTSLLSPDGPAFWLKVLPEDSFGRLVDTEINGFNAMQSFINGTLEGQRVTGSFSMEAASNALVQVSLTIPAALASIQNEGNLEITFDVNPAEIAPIQPEVSTTVPSIPTQPAVSTGSFTEATGLASYQDAQVGIEDSTTLMYTSAADVETLKQFYLEQFNTSGWTDTGNTMETAGIFITSWMKNDLTVNLMISPNGTSGSTVVLGTE